MLPGGESAWLLVVLDKGCYSAHTKASRSVIRQSSNGTTQLSLHCSVRYIHVVSSGGVFVVGADIDIKPQMCRSVVAMQEQYYKIISFRCPCNNMAIP